MKDAELLKVQDKNKTILELKERVNKVEEKLKN